EARVVRHGAGQVREHPLIALDAVEPDGCAAAQRAALGRVERAGDVPANELRAGPGREGGRAFREEDPFAGGPEWRAGGTARPDVAGYAGGRSELLLDGPAHEVLAQELESGERKAGQGGPVLRGAHVDRAEHSLLAHGRTAGGHMVGAALAVARPVQGDRGHGGAGPLTELVMRVVLELRRVELLLRPVPEHGRAERGLAGERAVQAREGNELVTGLVR